MGVCELFTFMEEVSNFRCRGSGGRGQHLFGFPVSPQRFPAVVPALFSLQQEPLIASRSAAGEKAEAGLARIGFARPCEQIAAFRLLGRAAEQKCFTLVTGQ